MVLNRADVIFHQESDYSIGHRTILLDLPQVGAEYNFLLPQKMRTQKHLNYLEDFEAGLDEAAKCSVSLDVQKEGPAEVNYRGIIQRTLHDMNFELWSPKQQQQKQVPLEKLCAAKLLMDYPELDFDWCCYLAKDTIYEKMGNRIPNSYTVITLEAGTQVFPIFTGLLRMETTDNSGLVMISDIDQAKRLLPALKELLVLDKPIRLAVHS